MKSLKLFPRDISIKYGSTKSMKWDTKIQRSGANVVRTCTHYRYPRWTIKVKATGLTNEDARRVQGFFASLRGAATPFLWFDFEDNKEEKIRLGVGDGVTKKYALIRAIGDFYEPVLDIIPDTLEVFVDGQKTAVTVGDGDGLVTFEVAPDSGAVITASFQYYWRVILEKDTFDITNKFLNFNESSDITFGVIR